MHTDILTERDYSCVIKVGAGLPAAVAAVSNVAGWWATHVSGCAEKSGDRFTVRFGKTYATIEVAVSTEDAKLNMTAGPVGMMNEKVDMRPGKVGMSADAKLEMTTGAVGMKTDAKLDMRPETDGIDAKAVGDGVKSGVRRTTDSMLDDKALSSTRIVWTVEDAYLPLFKDLRQWTGTRIVWDFCREAGQTTVRMTHVGLRPSLECYEDCEKGWNFYVGLSLYRLITEGQGIPGTGIFAHTALNGQRYEGVLFFKGDPLPDYPKGSLFLDVRETRGEEVLSFHGGGLYDPEQWDSGRLRGEYFMLLDKDALAAWRAISYHAQVIVGGTAAAAFPAICRVKDWWATDFEGESSALHDRFTIRFGDTYVSFEIVSLIPDQKIVWKVTDCFLHWLHDKKEWMDTWVEFELAETAKGTTIDMTHVGLVPGVECYENCEQGWDFFVKGSLYKLATDGVGTPNVPKVFR